MRRLLEAYNNGLKFCSIGAHLPNLDFAGFSALVGANATKAGIPYTCLARTKLPYLSAYVPVGTYGLAQAVLSCINWKPARILIGAGEVGSMLELCGLKATGNAEYMGLKSATGLLEVRGVVGEAVVVELLKQGKKNDLSPFGRDSGRPTCVVWAKITKPDADISGEVSVVGDIEGALINYVATGVATSVCVTVLVLLAMCHDWFTFALITVGMLLNAIMAFLLRAQKFLLPDARPAPGAPPGDAVVKLKDDPDAFCVLQGAEAPIQRLFQKETKLDARWVRDLHLFLVSVAFLIYSAVSVLGVPNMRATSQWMYLFVVCVGSGTDLIKGSWDSKRGIAKRAIEKYGIEVVHVTKFGNRTAAVVSIAAGSRAQLGTMKAAKLCPTTGTVWETWWTELERNLDRGIVEGEDSTNLDVVNPILQEDSDTKLWSCLSKDMLDGFQVATVVQQRLDADNLDQTDSAGENAV